MTLNKWKSIDEWPQDKVFLAILKKRWRVKIERVYTHTDNHFLQWKELRGLDKVGIGM